MKVLKKSALSLAVAGVVYGAVINPVYSADVSINQSGNAVSVGINASEATHTYDISNNGTETITVSGDTVLVSDTTNGTANALTIDVDGTNGGDNTLEADIIIDGGVNGLSDGTNSATGDGFVIQDSDSNDADDFEGSINVKGSIVGKTNGFLSKVGITGNLSVADGASILGETALELQVNHDGNVTNAGTIHSTDEDAGVAVAIAGVGASSKFINSSTGGISGVTAFTSSGTVTLENSGGITGHISGGAAITLDNKAGGDISGGNIDLNGGSATNAGVITTGQFNADNVTNDAGGVLSAGVLTSTGDVTNNGSFAVVEGSTAINLQNNSSLSINFTQDVEDGGNSATGLAVTTAAFDGDATVTVSLSGDALKTSGTKSYTILSGAVSNDDVGVIVSESVLLKAGTIDKTATEFTVSVDVLTAGDVVKDYGFGSNIQTLANQLQAGDVAAASVEAAYGKFTDNAANAEQLTSYINNVRPDDSGSSAHTASDAVSGAQNTISDRGVYTRSGVNTGGMIASGSFWMQALVSKSKQKSREGSLAYNGDMVGYTIGIDGDWDSNTTGFAFTYGSSDVDFDRDQKDKVKSYIGSVYNIWQKNNWYLDSSLSFGKSRHEGGRMKDAAALSSKYDSIQFGGQAMVGTYMPYQKVVIEPMLGLRMNHVTVDGYTAKNSDASLTETVSETKYKKIEGGLGAAFSTVSTIGNTTYQPRIAFMYYRDFVGEKIDQQVNFAGQDYTIQGASAEKNTYELKVGLNMWNESNMEINLGYTRVMQKDFSSDNFKFKFKYNF